MPTRVFFDWSRPLLPGMAERLLPVPGSGPLDLGDKLILAPTRQAGRRLREYLAREWRARGGTALLSMDVHPPSFLLQPAEDDPVAHAFDWTVAWRDVLTGLEPERLPGLFPQRNAPLGPEEALALGQRLQALREELLDAGLDLHDVARHPETALEADRWRDLAELETAYRDRLRALELLDPVDAKRERIRNFRPEPHVSTVILAGVPDPSPVVLRRLRGLEAEGWRFEVWIHAPESEADAFSDWGVPASSWRTRPLGRESEPPGWIEQVADPSTLARRVADITADAPDQPDLAFGLLHDASALPIRHELEAGGKRLYLPNPLSLAESPAARLLAALEDQRIHDDPESLRALWRHPGLLRACGVEDPEAWLAAWDDYASTSFPGNAAAVDQTLRDPVLLQAWKQMKAWLADRGAPGALRLLREAYREVELRPDVPEDRYRRRQLQAAAEVLQEAARREENGTPPPPGVLLATLGRETVDPPRVENALTAEGWLELPYHPAASLLLAGFQEGIVPPAPPPDGFLPNQLRRELGLKCDRDWLARDAYLLHTLILSRDPGHVRVLVLKRDAEGNPLLPSRYLFSCYRDEMLRRAELLFREPPPPPLQPPPSPGVALRPPTPPPPGPSTLSVTSLRDYLQCPTRFYLRHVLGMRSTDDTTRQPDALAFGTLVHAVLRDLAARDPSGEGDWNRAAREEVDRRIRERFGEPDGVALRVFARSALGRVEAAGRIHLDLRDQGWRPVALERKLERECDGLLIKGTIDRIDQHPDYGYRLLDYKTSDTPADPASAHFGPVRAGREAFEVAVGGRTRRWTDLQLPAYRWLAETDPEIGADVPMEVGYIALPKSLRQAGLLTWPEEASLIAEARSCLGAVVSGIRNGVWGPPTESVDFDEFAPLLHHGAEWVSTS